jgi:hypothetical protein
VTMAMAAAAPANSAVVLRNMALLFWCAESRLRR